MARVDAIRQYPGLKSAAERKAKGLTIGGDAAVEG